jgi:hypothetical protein
MNSAMTIFTKIAIIEITCAGNGKYYICETETALQSRVHVHKQHISVLEYRKIKISENLHFKTFSKQLTMQKYFALFIYHVTVRS